MIGLYFYEARWYDPAAGRFVQGDTIVTLDAQGVDHYAYVGNNPLKYIDPNGHMRDCGGEKFDPTCASHTNKYITQKDIEKLWDPQTKKDVGDVDAAELAFLHYLNDPDFFVNLFVNPAEWNSSREVKDFDVFLQYSVFHTTTSEFMAIGFDPDVANNLWTAHVAYSIGDIETSQSYLSAAGILTTGSSVLTHAGADAQYPKLANISNWHHLIPMYLGGDKNGAQYYIPASYHQYITNEFRQLWAYGKNKIPNTQELRYLIEQVYQKYPIPPNSTQR